MNKVDFDRYIQHFHENRAGITEAILGKAHDKGQQTPYKWVAAALPTDTTLVARCGKRERAYSGTSARQDIRCFGPVSS